MWLSDLFFGSSSVIHAVFITSLAAALGLALGTINFRGVSLGISGCLFSGILLSHFGFKIDTPTLSFLRDFGLILFVYTVGLQVGPSFMASIKSHGLKLNLLAVSVVLLGAGLVLAIAKFAGIAPTAALGIFAGASGNMPALGAAQSILGSMTGLSPQQTAEPALSCAVTYPFGVMGVILTQIVLRRAFGTDVEKEAVAYADSRKSHVEPLETLNIRVDNQNFNGQPLKEILRASGSDIVVSRIRRKGGALHLIAKSETLLHTGDVILAVGPKPALERLQKALGHESSLDLKSLPSGHASRRILVTRKRMAGRPADDLAFKKRHEAVITRIARGDIEFMPTSNVRLQFGDVVTVVGDEAALVAAERELGNSMRALGHPQIIPIFIGLVIGLFIGSIPFPIPGVPIPIKLGLAGGPLVAAIFLSYIGNIGPVVWYLPLSSNLVLREIGIVLFLTCVGLASGSAFFETLASAAGLEWLAWGALVTLVPIVTLALISRFAFKMNFLVMSGLMSGSMTNPPALSFSNSLVTSDAPSIAYTTVYPLTMILRVFLAQALALLLH